MYDWTTKIISVIIISTGENYFWFSIHTFFFLYTYTTTTQQQQAMLIYLWILSSIFRLSVSIVIMAMVCCVKLYKLHKKPLKFPFLFALLLQTIEHFVILCYIAVLLFWWCRGKVNHYQTPHSASLLFCLPLLLFAC